MKFPNGDIAYVDIQFGNFFYRATDLSIPCRGMNVMIKRFYNSNFVYEDSSFMNNWIHGVGILISTNTWLSILMINQSLLNSQQVKC